MLAPALGSLPGPERLSPLQTEVAALVREGLYRHEIARVLGTSSALIDSEIRSIYTVLGITDLLSLAMYAQHHHLRFLRSSLKSASLQAGIV